MALRNTVRSFFHWTGIAGERMEVMATNKETMNVIAKGMEKEATGRELIELNEMTFDIAATLAYQMSDRFMRIARKLEMESVKAIIYVLEHLDTEQATAALQAIFYSHGMVEAAQEMELLDICSAYDEGVYDYFIDEFMGTDEMDWFLVEICLKDGAAAQAVKAHPEQEES